MMPPETEPREPPKSRRAAEATLLLLLAFGPSVYVSFVYLLAAPARPPAADAAGPADGPPATGGVFFFAIIFNAFVLSLFVYILRRQGRRVKELGFNFLWSDIPLAALIVAFIFAANILWFAVSGTAYSLLTSGVFDPAPRNVGFLFEGLSLGLVAYLFLNPFYEELLVRAYAMTEAQFLTGRAWAAVVASVALQTSYHLYQGLAAAWMLLPTFVLFSLFYATWKRVTPLILAHLYLDLIPLLSYLESSG